MVYITSTAVFGELLEYRFCNHQNKSRSIYQFDNWFPNILRHMSMCTYSVSCYTWRHFGTGYLSIR